MMESCRHVRRERRKEGARTEREAEGVQERKRMRMQIEKDKEIMSKKFEKLQKSKKVFTNFLFLILM